MNTILIAILVLFTTWFYRIAFQKNAKVAKIPHPRRKPLIGNAFDIDPHNYSDTVYDFLEKSNEKLVALYVFNKPLIFLGDPVIAAELLKDDETYHRKGEGFNIFTLTMGDVLFIIDGQEWKERRTRLNHSFGFPKVKSIFPMINQKTIQSMDAINKSMATNGYVDMDGLFVKITGDIIFNFTMSKDFNIISEDENKIDEYYKLLRDQGFMHGYFPFWKYLPAPSRIKFALRKRQFHSFLESQIKERMASRKQDSETEAKDVLDVLIDNNVPVEEIRTELVGLTFAGHDTTAHTMAFALYELLKNEAVLKKLMQEIDNVIPDAVNGVASIARQEDVNKLEYLSVVIKEALRLYPIAIAHPVEVQKDVTIDGYDIPKGESIYIHYYSMQRSNKYWEDALVFKPDRWLDGSAKETEDNASQKNSKVYMPFLTGPHVCIGQHLAQLEMKVLLATLLKNFNFSIQPGFKMYAGAVITLTLLPELRLVASKRTRD